MPKLQNRNLAELLHQLSFTPPSKRLEQLEAAEKFHAHIDQSMDYPFEFVIFRITGHRPRTDVDWETINGKQLKQDLSAFIAALSAQVAPPAELQDEQIYSIDELAEKMNVSSKTIQRWRKKGLVARKFVFHDNIKRFGFTQSTVDEFLKQNSSLVKNASQFSRLTSREKRHIITLAARYAKRNNSSPRQVIEKVARETNKAHETIRYTISNYENETGRKVFEKRRSPISSAQAAEILRLYQQGTPVKELEEKFGRDRSSIYRIIKAKRVKTVLAQKLEFIDSPEFLAPDAVETILADTPQIKKILNRKLRKTNAETDRENALALNRDMETTLFRRYNFLKYLASRDRVGIKPTTVSARKLSRIEQYIQEAEHIKNLLVEANLQLVTTIARKHVAVRSATSDLVSEGNYSLLRAIEKFDYTRGVRFATYASWAITKDFARKIPQQGVRFDRSDAALSDAHRDFRITASTDFKAVEDARKSLIDVIKSELDEREQYIIINHFGLTGSLIRKNKRTLKQIGDDLELSKERVRQIELIALQKLRHSLSIEQFELLTE